MQINFDLQSLLFFVNVINEITSNLVEQIKKASIIIADIKEDLGTNSMFLKCLIVGDPGQ